MRGTNKVYDAIRERLIGGRFKPGSQLKEEPLARELGVSRTPVRAALKRLVEDGLATADAGQGIHVSQWTDVDIEETFQLRMLLEPHAAGLAAQRAGDEILHALIASNTQMARSIEQQDICGIQNANRAFHQALIESCGSPRLRSMLETMIDMPIIMRSFHIATAAEHAQSLHHHQDITAAVAARDGDLASQAMKLHLRVSHLRFMKHRDEYRNAAQGIHQ
jgi:DNA-binding GntR family transcriptional regulator